jgi:hypothetical protein
MSIATYQDAELYLKLWKMGTTPDMLEAFAWVYSDKFVPEYAEFISKCPPWSEDWTKVMKILNMYEIIGSIVKFEIINKEYLYDNLSVPMIWNRLKGIALGIREESGDSRFYENFEMMANDPLAH